MRIGRGRISRVVRVCVTAVRVVGNVVSGNRVDGVVHHAVVSGHDGGYTHPGRRSFSRLPDIEVPGVVNRVERVGESWVSAPIEGQVQVVGDDAVGHSAVVNRQNAGYTPPGG